MVISQEHLDLVEKFLDWVEDRTVWWQKHKGAPSALRYHLMYQACPGSQDQQLYMFLQFMRDPGVNSSNIITKQ